jgi:hypothetical protein
MSIGLLLYLQKWRPTWCAAIAQPAEQLLQHLDFAEVEVLKGIGFRGFDDRYDLNDRLPAKMRQAHCAASLNRGVTR